MNIISGNSNPSGAAGHSAAAGHSGAPERKKIIRPKRISL